jgi:predicted small secreted protein
MTARTGNKAGLSMKRLALITATLLALAGCNTIAGVGEDVSAGARTVQDML